MKLPHWLPLVISHPSAFILSRSGFAPSCLISAVNSAIEKANWPPIADERLIIWTRRPCNPICSSSFCAQSTRHQHAVSAVLEGAQDVEHVEFAGAGQFDDFDRGRILQAHRSGQIGGS